MWLDLWGFPNSFLALFIIAFVVALQRVFIITSSASWMICSTFLFLLRATESIRAFDVKWNWKIGIFYLLVNLESQNFTVFVQAWAIKRLIWQSWNEEISHIANAIRMNQRENEKRERKITKRKKKENEAVAKKQQQKRLFNRVDFYWDWFSRFDAMRCDASNVFFSLLLVIRKFLPTIEFKNEDAIEPIE